MNKPNDKIMSALSDVSTEELVDELSKRSGVTKISVGLYQPYELKRKYHKELLADEDVYVQAKKVLVIQND
ncbi:BC1881 family protein [Paenibacillus xylanexedens]|uniref:BC1881 family protein n=1 Tax=Paenibacillus xylanexedens TaxID=528191 RepID=UPI003D00E9BE